MKPTVKILFVALAALLGQTASGQSGGEYRIDTVAGTGRGGYSRDGGLAVEANLDYPYELTLDAAGNLYIVDLGYHRIRKVDASTGIISKVAAQFTHPYPRSVEADGAGNLYIADNARVHKMDAAGVVTTVAGTGEWGFSGDGGPAVEAQLYFPAGMAVDEAGNVYIADGNARIRKVDASTGNISTVAGTGVFGYSGDGAPATEALLNSPRSVALDGAGNLYIADTTNNRIRKVDASTGNISTVAGTGTRSYFSGDGGPAVEARLWSPEGVAVDGAGNIYIADTDDDRIRKVDASTGIITTIAGTGAPGFRGDGGRATQARLDEPHGVALDAAGNIYIADTYNHRVRRLTPPPADAPRISSGGIVLATGAPVVNRISPNAIISVFGSEFAPEGTQARSPMLDAAGRIATELAGVCLEIDGKRAPLFAVFPGQINAQAPHDARLLAPGQTYVTVGTSEVTAIRNCGAENERRSFAAEVEVASFSPAFFNLDGDAGGRNPIVAVRSDGTLAGPPGAVPGAEGLVPAEPGEILTFWGTGFGGTNPLLEAGQIPAGAAPITAEIEFTLGGITLSPEDVLYAGAAPGFAGIYQFAVRVPRSFPDSLRAPVIAAVNGVSSPEGPFLAVRSRE